MKKSSIIYIIGFRGCGKTTIGYLLSKELNFFFKDTDDIIQKDYNTTISNLVHTQGWEKFRKIESQILNKITEPNSIISTGGGIVLDKNNIIFMRKKGMVFYLSATLKLLKKRLLNDYKININQRPNLTNKYTSIHDEIDQVLPTRLNLYHKAAHFIINSDNLPKKIVQKILQKIK